MKHAMMGPPPQPGETLGQYVRRMRETRSPRKLLAAELASRMVVSQSTVSRLEQRNSAEPETLGKVALALDLSLGTLYHLAGYPGFVEDAHQAAVQAEFYDLITADSLRPIEAWLARQGLEREEVDVIGAVIQVYRDRAHARRGPVATNHPGQT